MLAKNPFPRFALLVGLLGLTFLLLGASMDAAAQADLLDDPITWGLNMRANSDYPPSYPNQWSQHEPHLAISRTNPDVVVVVAKDYRIGNNKEVWIYVSQDGGLTWPAEWQLQIPGMPGDIPNQSDPIAMARDDGRLYVVALGHNAGHGLFITWSDDDGVTWQDPSIAITYNETPYGLDDKEWLAIDNNPASPYYHNMYVAWATGGIQYKRSTDGGLTWTSNYITIAPGDTEYPYPVVSPDGTLYVFYMDGWGYCADGYIRFVKSTDGGVSFTGPYTVTDTSQPCSPIHLGGYDQFRFFSIITAAADPTNPNNLWVGWTDDNNITFGKTDVLYVRSTDAGITWSSPVRLSHDDPEAYIDHITPVFAMGQEGRLHAFWLDRRADPSNVMWHGYHTSTLDGVTWEPDTQVSTEAFDLNIYFPPPPGYNAAGDYWGLDVSGDVVMAAWNTTVETSQDIYVARGEYPPANPVTLTGVVSDQYTLLPLEGVEVSVNTSEWTLTDPSGVYSLTLSAGVYDVTAALSGYVTQTITGVELITGTYTLDIGLVKLVELSGVVREVDTLLPIQNALVSTDSGASAYTDLNGEYDLLLPPGSYTVTAQAAGYLPVSVGDVALVYDPVILDFNLISNFELYLPFLVKNP